MRFEDIENEVSQKEKRYMLGKKHLPNQDFI